MLAGVEEPFHVLGTQGPDHESTRVCEKAFLVSGRHALRDGYKKVMQRAAAVFEQTAEVLEQSAKLADAHAAREEKSGRPDEARDERRQAEWARNQARRARERAAASATLPR